MLRATGKLALAEYVGGYVSRICLGDLDLLRCIYLNHNELTHLTSIYDCVKCVQYMKSGTALVSFFRFN